jgi:hypothetical protein
MDYYELLESPYLRETVDPDILHALIAANSQREGLQFQAADSAASRSAQEYLSRLQGQNQLRLQQLAGRQQERLQGLDSQERVALERLRQAGGAYGGYGRPGGY